MMRVQLYVWRDEIVRVHAAAVCILSLRIRMNDLFMDAYMYAYVYTYVRVWREVDAYLCMRHSATDGRTDVDPPVLLGILSPPVY